MAGAPVLSAQYRVAADHPALSGHFPGHPVVPAAVLLRFAQRTLEGAGLRLAAIDSVKFLRPVAAGAAIDVTVIPQDSSRGSLTLSVAGEPVATGTWSAATRRATTGPASVPVSGK